MDFTPVRPDFKKLLFQPNARIHGLIDDKTVLEFLDGLKTIRENGEDLYLEVDTPGGDADGARRIALEIQLFLRHTRQNAFFVGKNTVYSAGVTVMAAFPRANRYLCPDAVLLIHERRLDTTVELKGPLQGCLQIIHEQLAMLETAEKLELQGFSQLVEGSKLSLDELRRRANENCYLMAEEALELGLIAEIAR